MRTRVKGIAIAMVCTLLIAAMAVSLWLLNKGLQQDKIYSGARFVYQKKAPDKAVV